MPPRPRHLLYSALTLALTVPLQAGGFEGGGGFLDGPIWLMIGLFIYGLFPLAALEGTYAHGAYAYWQFPLILLFAALFFRLFRFHRGGKRLFLLPLLYVVPVVLTNVCAQFYRIDHSNDFPIYRRLRELPLRHTLAEADFLARLGPPTHRALVSATHPELTAHIVEFMDRNALPSALILVYRETAWDSTYTHYLFLDPPTGAYRTHLTYFDWHKRPQAPRWPFIPPSA